MIAAPTAGDRYLGQVQVAYDRPREDGSTGTGAAFLASASPGWHKAVVAVRLDGEPAGPVLVVAPLGAAWVRAVHGGQEFSRAAVHDDAAVLSVPERDGVLVEAVDAGGRFLGAARIAEVGGVPGIDDWGREGPG